MQTARPSLDVIVIPGLTQGFQTGRNIFAQAYVYHNFARVVV